MVVNCVTVVIFVNFLEYGYVLSSSFAYAFLCHCEVLTVQIFILLVIAVDVDLGERAFREKLLSTDNQR